MACPPFLKAAPGAASRTMLALTNALLQAHRRRSPRSIQARAPRGSTAVRPILRTMPLARFVPTRDGSMSDIEQNIEALLSEERVFPPSGRLRRACHRQRPGRSTIAPTPTRGLLGGAGRAHSRGSRRWDTVMEWDAAVGAVVLGRHAERVRELPGPSRRGRRRRQGRLPLGGRARGYPDDHLRASSTRTSCRLANGLKSLGVRQGRPGQHLPGHGARAPDRDARVRADRRAALRGLRRASAPRRCATASTTPRPRC